MGTHKIVPSLSEKYEELLSKKLDDIAKEEAYKKACEYAGTDNIEVVEVKSMDSDDIQTYYINKDYHDAPFIVTDFKITASNVSQPLIDVMCPPKAGKQVNDALQDVWASYDKKPVMKKPHNSVDKMLSSVSKKDLLATIRHLLEEQGRTSVKLQGGGEKFLQNDTIVTQGHAGLTLAFRSLIDEADEELATEL